MASSGDVREELLEQLNLALSRRASASAQPGVADLDVSASIRLLAGLKQPPAERVAASPWACMGSDDILLPVLTCVARARWGGGYAHALVCSKWAQASPEAQLAVRVQHCYGDLDPNAVLQELRAFPNLTALDVSRWALDSARARDLVSLARNLGPRLQSLRFEDNLLSTNDPERARGAAGEGAGAVVQCSTSDALIALLLGCTRLQCLELPFVRGPLELQEDALEACARGGHLRSLVLSPWCWRTRYRQGCLPFDIPSSMTPGLLSVPASFGRLLGPSLLSLVLHSNTLEHLPDSFCELTRLQDLGLLCPNLAALPQPFGGLKDLASLWLFSGQLRRLPDSFWHLGSLQRLLLQCSGLEALPPAVKNLRRLRALAWRHMILHFDPRTLQEMTGLTRLEAGNGFHDAVAGHDLSSWRSLKSIITRYKEPVVGPVPVEMWSLPCLEELKLLERREQTSLHGEVGRLSSLKRLTICSCEWVQPPPLASLSNLEKLVIVKCSLVRELPEDLGQLRALQHLTLSLRRLQSIPESLGDLSALRHLELDGLNSLRALPGSLGQLKALQRLRLSGLWKLQSLPESLGDLSALRHLELVDLSSLSALPDSLGQLALLTSLAVRQCDDLRVLSIAGLQSLVELQLECQMLGEMRLGGVRGASALRSLDPSKLPSLVRVTRTESLESLDI